MKEPFGDPCGYGVEMSLPKFVSDPKGGTQMFTMDQIAGNQRHGFQDLRGDGGAPPRLEQDAQVGA